MRGGTVAEVAHCHTQITIKIRWMVSIYMNFLLIIIMKPEVALKRLRRFFRPSAFLLIFGGKSNHLALRRKLLPEGFVGRSLELGLKVWV